ncbi:MAG: 1-phosphofructokinase family hexose kinase [Halanaerobiales bacterium]|nr:1-phosphofructokinase family hexose kinase [Halanaerobiales bacterium]
MKKIATLTINPAIDKSSTVDNVVAENKLYCDKPRYEPGGGGINVSRAINKLDGKSLLLYISGGLTGQRLDNLLSEENLITQAIKIKNSVRENLIIREKTTNLQYRFGMPGPQILKEENKNILDTISNLDPYPDYLVMSGSIPEGVSSGIYAQLAKIAKENGAKVIVDAAKQPLKEAMNEGVFLIKPNLGEFQDLIGKELQDEDEIRDAALNLIKDNCCQSIVISLGAGGAMFITENKTRYLRPPTVPIKSKVGAGDSMVAGIVLSLARGNNMEKAVIYGLAAGSAAVMTPGTELCTKKDTEKLYKKMLDELYKK